MFDPLTRQATPCRRCPPSQKISQQEANWNHIKKILTPVLKRRKKCTRRETGRLRFRSADPPSDAMMPMSILQRISCQEANQNRLNDTLTWYQQGGIERCRKRQLGVRFLSADPMDNGALLMPPLWRMFRQEANWDRGNRILTPVSTRRNRVTSDVEGDRRGGFSIRQPIGRRHAANAPPLKNICIKKCNVNLYILSWYLMIAL